MHKPLTSALTNLGTAHHLPPDWLAHRPHLFSKAIFNLAATAAKAIEDTIGIVEQITALPTFQVAALSSATTATHKPKNPGVLFGYDFHLTPQGPKLIEINTNAGGAFCIALLEAAHGNLQALKTWERHFISMFLAEWQSVASTRPLRSIAIVDHDPTQQYFYPEFLLFQKLFQTHQIQCFIVDPKEFYLKDGKLWVENTIIDLVYNRLTDFDLSKPEHAVLQEAYIKNLTVLTPHPYAHALYANKRNLIYLSDVEFLAQCGLDEKTIAILQAVIPKAQFIDPQNAEQLWQTRKQFFFKPLSGYGGKGVYRGYNITKRVLADIVAGNYMAQLLVPPSEMEIDGEKRKADLRAYVYKGKVLGFGARLYQGQTTNFRTVGGGFAAVETGAS